MRLDQATNIAVQCGDELAPHCERIQIAGSIRRMAPDVGDIEIVCIPKTITVAVQQDMFGESHDVGVQHRSPEFVRVVDRWPTVKGKATGRYTQRMLPEGIKLDLFTAHRDNWGLILAIRTGSAAYSHKVLAATWSRLGYQSIEGMLHKGGNPVPVREERYLFDLLGIPFTSPANRN